MRLIGEAASRICSSIHRADSNAADFLVATAVWFQFDLDAVSVGCRRRSVLDRDSTS